MRKKALQDPSLCSFSEVRDKSSAVLPVFLRKLDIGVDFSPPSPPPALMLAPPVMPPRSGVQPPDLGRLFDGEILPPVLRPGVLVPLIIVPLLSDTALGDASNGGNNC